MLEQEIRSELRSRGFELNEMQEEAIKYKGKNIIIKAPTGSGKTEAVLLALQDGAECSYFLPTVPSTDIMFRRLSRDYPMIKWAIRTSTMKESTKTNIREREGQIEFMCPDAPLIEYLIKKRDSGIKLKNLSNVLILDEFDSYPQYVKGALREYISDFPETQVLVLSATLSLNDINMFKKMDSSKFITIDYSTDDEKFVKHRSVRIGVSGLDDVISENVKLNKKVGVIMNSITGMNYIKSHYMCGEYLKSMLVYHSQLDIDEKIDIESELARDNFSVVLTNDSLSMSVDIDFDVLIMEASDILNTNIQRLGRNNRKERKIEDIGVYKDVNLYVFSSCSSTKLKFVNASVQEDQIELLTNDYGYWQGSENPLEITKGDINSWRTRLPDADIPSYQDILKYWDELKSEGIEENLRDCSFEFVLYYKKNKIIKNGKNKGKNIEIDAKRILRFNNIPFSQYPYSSIEKWENDKRDIISVRNITYRIIGKEGQKYLIEEYNGSVYSASECNEEVWRLRRDLCLYYGIDYDSTDNLKHSQLIKMLQECEEECDE